LLGDALIILKYKNSSKYIFIGIPRNFITPYLYIIGARPKTTILGHTTRIQDNSTEYDDSFYDNKVNSEQTTLTPKAAPKPQKTKLGEKYFAKTSVGKGVIEKANYTCEADITHITFISKSSGNYFMEPHHLIPLSKQRFFKNDIDITPNIISLCPNCHSKIHYGTSADKEVLLRRFYTERINLLNLCGIEIDLETLLAFYDL